MTDRDSSFDRRDRFAYDPRTQPELFDGVLSKRIIAFVIDAIIIGLLMIPAVLVVFVVAVVTLGIGLLLFPPLFALVALGYVALTLGGPASATVGMRMAGLEMRTWSGAPVFPLLAIMHGLIFWISVGALSPLILVFGLFTYRKQLLHDLLLGTIVLNSGPLHGFAR
jgi:uncharacterized RDD family membrane protein YckC